MPRSNGMNSTACDPAAMNTRFEKAPPWGPMSTAAFSACRTGRRGSCTTTNRNWGFNAAATARRSASSWHTARTRCGALLTYSTVLLALVAVRLSSRLPVAIASSGIGGVACKASRRYLLMATMP